MSRRKLDSEELVRRILRFDEDLLRDDYPHELVDAEIRDAGGDPEAIRAEGEAFVKKLLAERDAAASKKASRTRLRSPAKATSPAPPAKARLTDPVEQWKALQSIGENDMLDPDYPDELVDQELREAGLDPEEVGREGEAFVKKLLAEKAEAARKVSTTRLRSTKKKPTSSLPPMREKAPSDTGPANEE